MSYTEVHLNEPGATHEERIAALEKQVEFLSKERPGRKMKPNITSQAGVCGIDPSRDSAVCPDASIYRYQQGCQGTECVKINRDYYAEYRAKRKQAAKPSAEAVVEPIPPLSPNGGAPTVSAVDPSPPYQPV